MLIGVALSVRKPGKWGPRLPWLGAATCGTTFALLVLSVLPSRTLQDFLLNVAMALLLAFLAAVGGGLSTPLFVSCIRRLGKWPDVVGA